MKGRKGAGVASPVRPSVRSNSCLLSEVLRCITQTKRDKPRSFEAPDILQRLMKLPQGELKVKLPLSGHPAQIKCDQV
jgi:hypothetical protein